MKKLFSLLLMLIVMVSSFAQKVPYAYAFNQGWYGNHLSNQNTALMAYNAGGRSIRLALYDRDISVKPTYALNDFAYYKALGMKDMIAFIDMPAEKNRLDTIFPGCTEKSKCWKGSYLPIFNADGSVNKNNTFAYYFYTTLITYDTFKIVRYWQIRNEPDQTPNWQSASNPNAAGSWFTNMPKTNELKNIQAPVPYYVRELEIAHTLVQKFAPGTLVGPGGLGYRSFAEILGKCTANPDGGKITTAFPNVGLKYCSVIGWHVYGFYEMYYWDPSVNGGKGAMVYMRNSDRMIQVLKEHHAGFRTSLSNLGFSKIPDILSETDMAREPALDGSTGNIEYGDSIGSIQYIAKAHIISQKLGIEQLYKYGMGEGTDGNAIYNRCGVYKNTSDPKTTVTNAIKAPQWYATSYQSKLLYGVPFSQSWTDSLKLPSNFEGGVLYDSVNKRRIIAVWPISKIDKVEYVSGLLNIPFSFKGRWYDVTGVDKGSVGQTVTLTSGIAYLVEDVPVIVTPPVVTPPVTTPRKAVKIIYNDGSEQPIN